MNLRNLLFTIGALLTSLILNAQNWDQISKIVAPDRAEKSYFGNAIAVDGGFAIIGAFGECFDENGEDSILWAGAAYIYNLTGNGWEFYQKIVPYNRSEDFYFGTSVAIENDIMVIGAFGEDIVDPGNDTIRNAGAIYIFKYNGSEWIEDGRVQASDYEGSAEFGKKLAISNGVIAVGVSKEKKDQNGQNPIVRAGAVYIIEKTSSGWQETQKIVASDRGAGYEFGSSVDLNDSLLVIGSSGAKYNDKRTGVVYVFKKESAVWEEKQILFGSKIFPDDNEDRFGCSVSISEDKILVGASGYKLNFVTSAGAAFLFTITADTIVESENLTLKDKNDWDRLGISVAVGGDFMIVGASGHDDGKEGDVPLQDAGSVFIYPVNGSNVLDTITITASDRIAGQHFGECIAYNDGMLFVGFPHDYRNEVGLDSLYGAGSVYFYSEIPLTGYQSQDADVSIGPDAGLTVYPNPTSGIITVESTEIQKITISDISGRIIYENSDPSNNQTIDLGKFKGKLYILTIHTQTTTINKKIIKK